MAGLTAGAVKGRPTMAEPTFHGIHGIVCAMFGRRREARSHGDAASGAVLASTRRARRPPHWASPPKSPSSRCAERCAVMEWVSEDVAGKCAARVHHLPVHPFARTIAQVRVAEANRADWVILQSPMVGSYGAAEYINFFGRIARPASPRRHPERTSA